MSCYKDRENDEEPYNVRTSSGEQVCEKCHSSEYAKKQTNSNFIS